MEDNTQFEDLLHDIVIAPDDAADEKANSSDLGRQSSQEGKSSDHL